MRLEARRDLETALPTFLRERLGVPRPIASIRESIVKVVARLLAFLERVCDSKWVNYFILRSPAPLPGTVFLLAP